MMKFNLKRRFDRVKYCISGFQRLWLHPAYLFAEHYTDFESFLDIQPGRAVFCEALKADPAIVLDHVLQHEHTAHCQLLDQPSFKSISDYSAQRYS